VDRARQAQPVEDDQAGGSSGITCYGRGAGGAAGTARRSGRLDPWNSHGVERDPPISALSSSRGEVRREAAPDRNAAWLPSGRGELRGVHADECRGFSRTFPSSLSRTGPAFKHAGLLELVRHEIGPCTCRNGADHAGGRSGLYSVPGRSKSRGDRCLSAGASMAALLTTRHPERFSAVVMHSGIPPGTADSTLSAVGAMRGRRATKALATTPSSMAVPWPPLLVVHGDRDAIVSPQNGRAAAHLWADAAHARASIPRAVERGRRHPMKVTAYKRHGMTIATLVRSPVWAIRGAEADRMNASVMRRVPMPHGWFGLSLRASSRRAGT
jgi:hypothetical protein